MGKRNLRVMVDTNILVSMVIAPGEQMRILLKLWEQGKFDLMISEQVLQEIEMVLSRPVVVQRYRVTGRRRKRVMRAFRSQGVVVADAKTIPIATRDPKDDVILATAIDKADVLVTGDEDLLSERNNTNLKGMKIMRLSEFTRKMRR